MSTFSSPDIENSEVDLGRMYFSFFMKEEWRLIKEPSELTVRQLNVCLLKSRGLGWRQIIDEVGCSHTTYYKMLRSARAGLVLGSDERLVSGNLDGHSLDYYQKEEFAKEIMTYGQNLSAKELLIVLNRKYESDFQIGYVYRLMRKFFIPANPEVRSSALLAIYLIIHEPGQCPEYFN